jgi:two-component system LytT family response regulator
MAISGQDEIIYIELENIIRLESDSNYTNVFLTGGKKITSSKTLKEYEGSLSTNFFRTHKAYIINLDHVEKYVRADGGYIVMTDKVQIPISREKRQVLINMLATR